MDRLSYDTYLAFAAIHLEKVLDALLLFTHTYTGGDYLARYKDLVARLEFYRVVFHSEFDDAFLQGFLQKAIDLEHAIRTDYLGRIRELAHGV